LDFSSSLVNLTSRILTSEVSPYLQCAWFRLQLFFQPVGVRRPAASRQRTHSPPRASGVLQTGPKHTAFLPRLLLQHGPRREPPCGRKRWAIGICSRHDPFIWVAVLPCYWGVGRRSNLFLSLLFVQRNIIFLTSNISYRIYILVKSLSMAVSCLLWPRSQGRTHSSASVSSLTPKNWRFHAIFNLLYYVVVVLVFGCATWAVLPQCGSSWRRNICHRFLKYLNSCWDVALFPSYNVALICFTENSAPLFCFNWFYTLIVFRIDTVVLSPAKRNMTTDLYLKCRSYGFWWR
jgi:hypothetical protein